MKAESLSEDILICDARVVLPNQVEAGYDVLIVDGKIAAIGKGLSKTGVKKIEAGGLYLAPGLIDIHIHGAMGMMCEDPTSEELAVMSLSLAR
ncbi:MAG: hypothetical protein GY866_39510, partial [Proteobacteria bacterium]|nr:hypothetical protein [Pseudomonadota bacterium]